MAAPTLAEMRTRVRERVRLSTNDPLFTDAVVNRHINIAYGNFLSVQPDGWWWQRNEQTIQNGALERVYFPVALATPDGTRLIRKVHSVFVSLDGDYWLPVAQRERQDQIRLAGGRRVADGIPLSWAAVPNVDYAAPTLVPDELVAYDLDETTGTVATDRSGGGNDGTYEGVVTLGQPSLRPDAAGFATRIAGGTANRIRSGAVFPLAVYTAGAGIAAIVKVTALPTAVGERLAFLGNDATGVGFGLYLNPAGTFNFQWIGLGPGFSGWSSGIGAPVVLGTTYRLYGQYNGTRGQLFVNEVLSEQNTPTTDPTNVLAGSRFVVGREISPSTSAIVTIDDAFAYAVPLTPEQIAARYSPRSDLALVFDPPLPAGAYVRYICVAGAAPLTADGSFLYGLPPMLADAVVEAAVTSIVRQQRGATSAAARRRYLSELALASDASDGWIRAARTYMNSPAAGPGYATQLDRMGP